MSLPRETLARYITPGCTFIETGARWGDSLIRAAELGAAHVYSCESDGIMAAIAREHAQDVLARMDIDLEVSGQDSETWLPDIADGMDEPVILFLDAHTSHESPILKELSAVKREWQPKPAIILIDDVRLFRSKQWGISLDDVLAAVRAVGDYEISYDMGIQPEDVLVARLRA